VLEETLRDGSLRRVAFAVLVVALSAVAERVWVALRWQPYFAAGIPLAEDPLPIARKPTESAGAVAGVRWERVPGREAARWWADPERRIFPGGLHGIVYFGASGRGIQLVVRWSPPWTPIVAFLWLAGVGAADGQGWMTVPLAVLLTFGLAGLYRREAARAAAALRYGWARGDDAGG
jgi:hypothetical protein